MAITQGAVKFKVVMDRASSDGPIFTFQDTSSYTDYTLVTSAIAVEANGEVWYDNLDNFILDPDISGASAGQSNGDLTRARTVSTPIPIPTDTDGVPVSGFYKFTYKINDDGTTVTNVITMNCSFETPTGDLSSVLDLTPTSPSITITDETNYIVSNITPTSAEPVITLYYPSNTNEPATSVEASSLIATTFYTGQQIAELSAEKVWNFSTKIVTSETNNYTSGNFTLFINDTVTDTIYISVEANNNICALFCCLKDFATKMLAAKSRPSEYARLRDIAGQVAFFYNSIDAAYQCSKTQNVNLWVQEIRDLVGCDDDCECGDGAPVQITAISSVNVVVGTVISFVTSGVVTEYQNALLINSTYSATQQNFLVFADGLKVTGTHNLTTGTFTPTYSWASGVQIEIIKLKA